MKAIVGREKVNVSAGIIVARKLEEEYLFLLLGYKDYFDFPKGRTEDGEVALDTALRETEEESGLTPNDLNFSWGEEWKCTEAYNGAGGRKIAVYFLAETNKEEIELLMNPDTGRVEHDEFVWASYTTAKSLLGKRVGRILDWANDKIKEE